MAYQPQSFPGFGDGLNLRDKADAVRESEAIDCMNVVFTERGAVTQRPGYSTLIPIGYLGTGQGDTLHPHYESDGTKHLIVGDIESGALTALSQIGFEQDTETAPATGGCWGFQRFGAPGVERTYCGNGSVTGDTIWYYDGSTFTQNAATSPEGGALAISPGQGGNTSNRLVNARFGNATGGPSGAATDPSTIWFSNAGDATTWGANNYLRLGPGDGEAIQAMVNWREYLFVFKETKFFVFTGETVSAAGTPIFNYYTVDTGYGACGPRAVTADETGVYFASRKGVHRTTGGVPEKVSDLVEPIFLGQSSDYFTGGELNHTYADKIAVNAFDGQVYINYPAGTATTNSRTLVFDTTYNWWSLWDVAAADMVGYRGYTDQERLYFTAPAGNNDVFYLSPDLTNDDGGTITSYWRSGWFDYGMPETKTIRETKVWGTGRIYLGVSKDFAEDPGTLDRINMRNPNDDNWNETTWGGGVWATATPRVPALRRRAVRGTVFSTYFYNSNRDEEWTISRLDHHLREKRIPSVKTG